MSQHIPLGEITRSRAKVFISALLELSNLVELGKTSWLDPLRKIYCKSQPSAIAFNGTSISGVIEVKTTMSSLCNFIIDYEDYSPIPIEKLFSSAQSQPKRSKEDIVHDRIRDTISALKKLNILEEKKADKPNEKNRIFLIRLKRANDIRANISLLFDGAESEWEKRKLDAQSTIDEHDWENDLPSNSIKISEIATQAISKRGKNIALHLPRGNEIIWGRRDFIANMLSYFSSPDSKHIISLSSPPGYGKTDAATCLGWEAVANSIFDDVIYVRARQSLLLEAGSDLSEIQDALDWQQFAAKLSQQLFCPIDQIPKKLREKKYLIILDNAETANYKQIIEAMDHMLNPSCLLLTSRILSNNHRHVYSKELGGLDYEAAFLPLVKSESERHQITAILEADQAALREIYKLSNGAPLAIHFILSRAKLDQTLEHIFFDLNKANRNVEHFYKFTFEFAWDYVSEESKSVLLHLSRFNNSISEKEIKESCEFNDEDFRYFKHELRLVYLINVDSSSDEARIDLHPWIRTAIRNKLPNYWNKPSLSEIQKIIQVRFEW